MQSRRPRIGLVSPLPPQTGGVASVAGWLLEHQGEIGCEYDAFDLWRPANGEMGGRFRLASIPRQLGLLARYRRWLRTAPRVIHVCVAASVLSLLRDLALVALAHRSGRTVLVHVHGSEFAIKRSARFFHVPAMRLHARLSSERIAVTPWSARTLAQIAISSRCIFNPVRLTPGDAPTVREGDEQELRLLLVGTYGEAKGCHELIDAVASVRAQGIPVRLALAGKEMYRGEEQELRERARSHRLNGAVRFLGLLAPDELKREYAAADVVCLPSHREVLPMALLEGMAFGLPALVTSVGGMPDVVQPGRTGLIVPPRRADELAEAIRLIAADPAQTRRMGEAARDRVQTLMAPELIAAEWRALYDTYA